MPPKGVGWRRTFSGSTRTIPASSASETRSAREIVGPGIAGRAEGHVAGDAQRLGLVAGPDGGEERAEDLLLRDA